MAANIDGDYPVWEMLPQARINNMPTLMLHVPAALIAALH